VFRRVSVVSGVRSLSLYLVVSCCVSQLVIVICVVIIALVNNLVSNLNPRRVISHTTHLEYVTIYIYMSGSLTTYEVQGPHTYASILPPFTHI
jgi:ABC-type transport system involved in multi-copper enzyme maturation permease subunit